MLPPRNATYCETATSTRRPSHSTIRVSGSNVTSVRNGSPSTRPSMSTDACRDTGKSGFVIVAGSENEGIATSTRSWVGATGRFPGTAGCGISPGTELTDATGVTERSWTAPSPVHAATGIAMRSARSEPVAPRRAVRDPSPYPIAHSLVVVTRTTMAGRR